MNTQLVHAWVSDDLTSVALGTRGRLPHPGAAAVPTSEVAMNCPVQVAAGSEAEVTAHGIPKCQAL